MNHFLKLSSISSFQTDINNSTDVSLFLKVFFLSFFHKFHIEKKKDIFGLAVRYLLTPIYLFTQ